MLFSEYMSEWLYGENGYYRNFNNIGKEGDFYTAVSTSSFFGASIAQFLYNKIKSNEVPRDAYLIEIGAHQGYLICDMIQWLYTCDPSLISAMTFAIVERQESVRDAQLKYIESRFGSDVKVVHFSDITEVKVEYAFFVANEIFDAFPCDLIKDKKLAIVDNHTISWEDASEEKLKWAESQRLIQGEIAVGYEEFAKSMSNSCKSCDFVTFDYGEKYVRNDFSIRVYRKHETFPLFDENLNLEESFQNDDITYDVNFEHLSDAFRSSSFSEITYETQARALIRFGLIDILEQFARQTTQERYLREADKIKTLIAPTIMGDKFKMIHFSK